MTRESFHVNEIALWAREGSRFVGHEVTVTGPLQFVKAWQPDGSWVIDLRYPIEAAFAPEPPHGNGWCAKPEWLRKRRPPLDPAFRRFRDDLLHDVAQLQSPPIPLAREALRA